MATFPRVRGGRTSRVRVLRTGVPTRARGTPTIEPRARLLSLGAVARKEGFERDAQWSWELHAPLMHPVLEWIRSTRIGGFEDCTKVPKVAKIAGSPRVQSSRRSCNLRERPRCLATTRYDRDNHEDRRNPLDQPCVNRFQTTTRWSRTHRQFFVETPRSSPSDRGGRHTLTRSVSEGDRRHSQR